MTEMIDPEVRLESIDGGALIESENAGVVHQSIDAQIV
jgi:hypothetical protein